MVMLTRQMFEDWGACGDVNRLFEIVQPGGGDEFELTDDALREILRSPDGEVWLDWFRTVVIPARLRPSFTDGLGAIEEAERWAFIEGLIGRRVNFIRQWAVRNWSQLPGTKMGSEATNAPAAYLARVRGQHNAALSHHGGPPSAVERAPYEGAARLAAEMAANPPSVGHLAAARRYLEQGPGRVLGQQGAASNGRHLLNQLRSMELDRSEAASLIRIIRERARR